MSGLIPPIKLNRKVLLGSGIVFLLLIASIGIIQIQSQKSDLIRQLESANFIVQKFDIIDGSPDALDAIGELYVNTNRTEVPSELKITKFEIDLFNRSEFITSLRVPIDNLLESEIINFDISIPVNRYDPSPVTTNLLVNIMTGVEFFLNFTSRISYQIGGFPGNLEFSNAVYFFLNQPVLELDLERLSIPNSESQTITQIIFDLYNPFSIDIRMSGDIDIVVQSMLVGNIDLKESTFIPGTNAVVENVELIISLQDLYSLYFSSITEPIQLITSLNLSFGQLSLDVSPTLNLQTEGIDLAFNITELESLTINSQNGGISGVLGGDIISYLPITFNLTRIEGEILSGQDTVGEVIWEGNSTSVLLLSGESVRLRGIKFNSSLDKIPLYSNLESNLGFRNVSIVIYVFNELIAYDLNL